jgi:two-component SAPR family response regulator/nucleoid-associated protein YgaU
VELTPDAHALPTRSARRHERLRLFAFSGLMLLAGVGLAATGGPPRVPSGVPRIQDVTAALSGSTLPLQPLVLVLIDLAWAVWGWILASLAVQLLLEVAEAVTRGAAWVRSLRRYADRLTFPLARRAVAAAFAMQILSRGVPLASAQPLSAAEVVYLAQSQSGPASFDTIQGADAESNPVEASYLVRPGDTLWSIADHAYGSGAAYRRLVEANLGRRMPDGQTFTARGVIQPGWELIIPEADQGVEELDGQRWYTVQPGDTLLRVAGVVLGDESQWRTVFEMNRGTVSPDGSHVLANPNVIWAGLRLRLPPPGPAADTAPPPTPASERAPDSRPEPEPVPEPAPAELLATAAAVSAAPPAVVEPAISPLAAPTSSIPPAELDPPPLVRTAHPSVVPTIEPSETAPIDAEPVALQPADANDADHTNVAPEPGSTVPGAWPVSDMPLGPLLLGGLGAAGVAAAALGARRARRLRPLPLEPETEVVVEGGFAEAQLAHDFTRGLHGVGFDPLAAIVGRLHAYLEEYNLGDVGIVAIRHGRSATTLTLSATLAQQPILIDLAPVFGAALEADAEAWVTADQDVAIRLVRPRKTRLLPSSDLPPDSVCLVPLGVLYDRQVYVATCGSLGHVLVVSQPGHGADTILTSLVATLTARRSPEQLGVWLIAEPRALPAPLFELPHLVRSVDPSDEAALARAADDLRAEIDSRTLQTTSSPDLVVVVPELTGLGSLAETFALLANRAAHLGIRFIAGSSCPGEVLLSPLVAHFGTRMVLHMPDEETSVALLGVADAAFIGGGGRLLLRLDGREPVELYGYQVAGEHLDRLVRVMRSAYPSRPVASSHTDQPAPSAPPGSADGQAASPSEFVAATQATPDPLPQAEAAPPGDARQPVAESPPIEVICLGGPRVLCGGQQVWPRSPAGEAKPWEFLLYIATQPAEGVSSEQTVESLWPEDEILDAGHRFRQLRYRLRHQLARIDGAPSTDGICLERGTLRLDPSVIYSDAQEFLELIRCARLDPGPGAIPLLERARSLYAGDLLEGPDARRYAWADERGASGVTLREHFRRLFQNGSFRLAEMYAAAGELEASIDLYRELSELDPGDERLWRALFRLHAQRGDRVALVREEYRMREALRDLAAEVDDDAGDDLPDANDETAQEYQRLLTSLRDREREPAAV